jgi:hypothetical protein
VDEEPEVRHELTPEEEEYFRKVDKQKSERAIIENRMNNHDKEKKVLFSYGDLLAGLQKLTPEQLAQEVRLMKGNSSHRLALLKPVVAVGTVEEMCHVDGEVVTETRGPGFVHNPAQVILVYDGPEFDEDGDTYYTMEDGINEETGKKEIMLRGNVTRKLKKIGEGRRG